MKTKNPLIVHLREREIADGKIQLYLDISRNGRRWKETTHQVLLPGKDRLTKKKNEEIRLVAASIAKRREEELRNEIIGVTASGKGYLDDFLTYMENLAASRKPGTRSMWKSSINHIRVYDKRPEILFADITREWLEGLRRYLINDAYVLRKPADPNNAWRVKHKLGDGVGRIKLSTHAASGIWKKVVCTLHSAMTDRLILYNPADGVPGIPCEDGKREYLTKEELQRLIDTPSRSRVRDAFLFCCVTGLRYSDVSDLRWRDIEVGADGRTTMSVKMNKTDRYVYVPLNQSALALAGERGAEDDKVFNLPANSVCNKSIGVWVAHAGIKKRITFHCSRHTFATQLLANDVDIYTTSKLLGHTDVRTTQVYAKVVDEKRRAAVDAIDGII